MNNTEIEFDFQEKFEVRAFAQLIRELNETGVPYEVIQDENASMTVTVKIGDGY
jgi:hypothetical protein